MRKIVLELAYDSDTENPFELSDWEFVSFNTRHSSFKHPDNYKNIGIQKKIKAGTAFVLDYFEHGNCVWSLSGSGPQCKWDQSRNAGLLIWKGKPKHLGTTIESRREVAKRMMEVYTEWCNGQCFWYNAETNDGIEIDSCGGFIGDDDLFSHLKSEVFKPGDYVVIKGDCRDMVNYHDLGDDVKIVTDFAEVPDDARKVAEIRIVLDGPNGTIYWPKYEGEEVLSSTSLELEQALELLRNNTPFVVAIDNPPDSPILFQSGVMNQVRI
jgi:hypothetical protein